jgi:hypothetical protein
MATLETQYQNWLKDNEPIEYSEWLNRFSKIHHLDKIGQASSSKDQKTLVEQLIKASTEISKNRKPDANYIHLSKEFIQQQANEQKISFHEMVEIIKKETAPTK